MSRQVVLEKLRSAVPVIAASMLKCDFADLRREIRLLEEAGAGAIHWDVMDGHFVPNLSYGPLVIERLRAVTDLPFDAHLMISEPERYLDEFLAAGCDCVTFHIEAVPNDAQRLLERIREADAVAGVALSPETPVEAVAPLLPSCDLVLVMSVEPGFGGQEFIPFTKGKLRKLRELSPPDLLLGVDGGVGPSTIAAAAEAGANVFVVGSAIFQADDYRRAIDQLICLARDRLPVSS